MPQPSRRISWTVFVACLMVIGLASAPTVLASGSDPAPQEVIRLKTLDWVVIAAYGVGLLAVGWYFSRRTTSTEDYHLGGRSMRAGAVGLSLFATLLSTITYLAIPGEMIKHGPVILWSVAAIPVAYVIVGYILIPHFMKLRVTSAYEILETRLGIQIRLIGATIFLITRLLWMALIIYLTADKIIVVMMGWDPSTVPYVAAGIGLLTVIYTSMGGLRAVVFSDVLQSFILLGGAILSILLITIKMGGFGWWPSEWSSNWSHQPVFSLDPHVRVTVVGSIVFMIVWWICTAGSDQMAIQRYLATRDVRAARRAFLTTGIANVVITALLAALGFALLGFFQANPHLLQASMSLSQEATADKIFPYFIVRMLPAGITGLVIAGLLAAAMSSLSSGINSSSSVITTDFVNRFRQHETSESDRVREAKIVAVISGLVAVLLSTAMGRVTGNIMEVTVRTNHIFVAPLFGLFFMAMFIRFATPFGTACGALAGCGIAVVIAYWDIFTGNPESKLSFQWISLISLITNLAVGIPLSLLPRQIAQSLTRLTTRALPAVVVGIAVLLIAWATRPSPTAWTIDQPQPYRAARSSSHDPTGGNADRAQLAPGESLTVAELTGPGRIVHMWFTISTDEPDYLRTTRLEIHWDGHEEPAVDVPLGDFHALGHGLIRKVDNAFITVLARPQLNHNLPNKNVGGMNSWFPMPYADGATVIIRNTSEKPLKALYYQIDYQTWDNPPSPLRFHAQYGETPPDRLDTAPSASLNPDGEDNHVILDTKGRGHLIGVVLSVDAMGEGWWEGDEMIWIDGETTTSIHGTGTEDYFCGAWGFRHEYNMPHHGVSLIERVAGRDDWRAGKFTVYRFHERDPIPFTRSIKVSIERGHANSRRDCPYASVAYWYQLP